MVPSQLCAVGERGKIHDSKVKVDQMQIREPVRAPTSSACRIANDLLTTAFLLREIAVQSNTKTGRTFSDGGSGLRQFVTWIEPPPISTADLGRRIECNLLDFGNHLQKTTIPPLPNKTYL